MKAAICTAALSLALAACGGDPAISELNESTIRELSTTIVTATTSPASNGTLNVDVTIAKQPFTGGGQDWNSLASDSDRLLKAMLPSGKLAQLSITAVAPDNGNLDWARIQYNSQALGANWQDLTYLQRFATADIKPGTLEAAGWLCDFYASYASAKPDDATCP